MKTLNYFFQSKLLLALFIGKKICCINFFSKYFLNKKNIAVKAFIFCISQEFLFTEIDHFFFLKNFNINFETCFESKILGMFYIDNI